MNEGTDTLQEKSSAGANSRRDDSPDIIAVRNGFLTAYLFAR
ncbi:MAG: hypothetical protein ABIK83_06260 [Candidatus Zixiibacteriota bacterium]